MWRTGDRRQETRGEDTRERRRETGDRRGKMGDGDRRGFSDLVSKKCSAYNLLNLVGEYINF